jgi:hypothetical protein
MKKKATLPYKKDPLVRNVHEVTCTPEPVLTWLQGQIPFFTENFHEASIWGQLYCGLKIRLTTVTANCIRSERRLHCK